MKKKSIYNAQPDIDFTSLDPQSLLGLDELGLVGLSHARIRDSDGVWSWLIRCDSGDPQQRNYGVPIKESSPVTLPPIENKDAGACVILSIACLFRAQPKDGKNLAH
ncbi:hypothetical protein [Actinotignum urinale]|uniref:hypothetical protein n=1 Tax=Actinotignum urinale TaxID=190146 RepID=UPI00280B474C|nr:hypothetical protein [Actinotignum urinale]